MRYIQIDKAQPGMVLAKPIFDESGRVLLGAYSTLNAEFINKLFTRGFPGCYIEDDLTDDIVIDETITIELRNKGVQALKRRDIEGTIEVAKSIVDQILNSKSISLELVDLRGFDDYTYRHSVNVAVLATVVGMKMQFSTTELQELCVAAIFHDIGKVLIDPEILNKPGKLTKEEFELVKQHPQNSYDLIKDRWDISAKSKASILGHHENENGTGYPRGIKGDEIHLYAKIIHVVDVYDALTSKRPYKNDYSPSEALEYLMATGGRYFYNPVIEAFIATVPVYPKATTVTLSDGKEAVVVDHSTNPLRPIVRFEDGTEVNLSENRDYLNVTIVSNEEVEDDFIAEEERRKTHRQ